MICIHICSGGEWHSIKEILKVKKSDINIYPFGEYIKCKLYNRECIFYHSGATKTRSAAACQYAIDNWKPETLFVMGTCGGVDEGLNVFDVVIANKTVQYDCIDRMGNEPYVFYEPLTTQIDNAWIDFSELKFKIHEGTIATADQDINFEVLKMLRGERVLCADWESGAIAHICNLNKVRCCILRGISDIPTENIEESEINQGIDYHENTPVIMKNLVQNVLQAICKSF